MLAALTAVGGLVGGGAVARAAEPELRFDISPRAREEALIDFAAQAGLSIGFAPGARCGGQAGVTGRMTAAAALARLLTGSTCEAVRPDARTLVIRPRRAPPPAPVSPAAAPAPPSVVDIAELVVTGEKRETLLSSSASALSVMSGADMARAGVSDVGDLSLLSAGVTVTNLGPGRNKILLRGLSDGPLTGHAQSTVGIYLGELRLTYNAPDPDLPLADIARVEVLRGPQGSLYGAGSVGGVLHIVPNPPDPTSAYGRIEGAVGDTRHGAASRSAQVMLNRPLLDGAAAVRLVAWSEIAGGSIDDTARGLADVDRTRRKGMRLSGAWRPTDAVALETTFVSQSIATRDAHYAEGPVGSLSRAAAVAQPHDNDLLAISTTLRWTLDGARLTATVGALDHEVSTTYDAASAPAVLVAPGAAPRRFSDENEIRGVLGEVRVESARPGRFQWVAGAFGALGRQRLDADLLATGGEGYAEARRDNLLEAALFGEASYDLTDRLTLTAGGRAFVSRLETDSRVFLGAPLRHFDGRLTDSGFAPKLKLVFRLSPRASVYASAAEGYRAAGFNTGGPPGQVFGRDEGSLPLRRYGGDELWSYEAGVRWRSADHALSVRGAAFLADWRDIQADLILPSGLPYTADFGDGRSRGAEVEASWRRGALNVAVNAVWQDPELVSRPAGLASLHEASLPGMPRVSAAATAGYTVALGEGLNLDLAASYAYVGHARLTFDAATAPSMGDYSTLRLAATLRSGPWEAGVSVDNALDSRGDTLAFGNPFSFRAGDQHTPQRPRTIRLTASRAF